MSSSDSSRWLERTWPHHQPKGLQSGLIRSAGTDRGLELLCEQLQHYSAEPHEKQPYLGQGQQLKYDNER